MAPAAQAEAIGSRGHATDRRELREAVPEGYIKGQTWPKTAASVGLTLSAPFNSFLPAPDRSFSRR